MYITINGIQLYYETIGNGRPIILCHGNGGDHTVFAPFAKALSPHYTVYLPDSRGHGNSEAVRSLHYQDIADDITKFIQEKHIEKPIFYGLSDGGIIGLLIASQHPGLLSKLIISGANTHPFGLKINMYFAILWMYIRKRSNMLRMILIEPHISKQQLRTIKIPTLVLAGEKDMIREHHTRSIAKAIPHATVRILPNEGHTSYVEHTDAIYDIVKDFLQP